MTSAEQETDVKEGLSIIVTFKPLEIFKVTLGHLPFEKWVYLITVDVRAAPKQEIIV